MLHDVVKNMKPDKLNLQALQQHVNVPWTDELALAAFMQLNADRRSQQRLAFPLGDNLSAVILVSLADLAPC